MTPALKLLKGKPHRTLEYAHDPAFTRLRGRSRPHAGA